MFRQGIFTDMRKVIKNFLYIYYQINPCLTIFLSIEVTFLTQLDCRKVAWHDFGLNQHSPQQILDLVKELKWGTYHLS